MIYFLSINYYSTELLRQLLSSITQLDEAIPYRILVVNNSPDDLLVESLLPEFDRVTVITAKENLGFGGGCNLGLEYILSRDPQALVWLINPDACLVSGAILYVKTCFEQQPQLSILGTRIQANDGDLWFAQGQFNWWTGSLKHRLPQADTAAHPVAVLPSRWVSGCSMIFNLQQFEHCPQFDLNFFLDYEDIEICERYFRQGHDIGVTQAVLVHHVVSAITHRNRQAKFRHATFSKLYFLYKHGSWLSLGLNLAYILLWSAKLCLSDWETGGGRFLGWMDFWQWWGQHLTRSGSAQPFRPRTAFTQAYQSLE